MRHILVGSTSGLNCALHMDNFLKSRVYNMGMDVGEPSANGLYSGAGAQGNPPDIGSGMGRYLVGSELDHRTQYAAPTNPEQIVQPAIAPGQPGGPPEYYNYQGGLPVKYDVPTAQKERLQARAEVRKAAGLEKSEDRSAFTLRTDPIHDEEVDYLMAMKEKTELARFDTYVNTLIDPRKPGNLKWLMEIYPQYVDRRIQQVHTDYEFALRNQMIDSWGINTFDDLHFKYMVDQGKIDGPRLAKHANLSDVYAPGLLSPWSFKANGDNNPAGVRLPFASATFGRRPAAPSEWELTNDNPLNQGKNTADLARNMYRPAGGIPRPVPHGDADGVMGLR